MSMRWSEKRTRRRPEGDAAGEEDKVTTLDTFAAVGAGLAFLLFVASVYVGSREVRELRRTTGDRSILTFILGLEFLRRQ